METARYGRGAAVRALHSDQSWRGDVFAEGSCSICRDTSVFWLLLDLLACRASLFHVLKQAECWLWGFRGFGVSL